MIYQVKKIESAMPKGKWDTGLWQDISPVDIDNYMGDKPEHMPKTQAKLAYDNEYIYATFRVENDIYIKSSYTNHQDPVWQDSCVEFFFTPNTDTTTGYYGLEINCGGIMLFYRKSNGATDIDAISQDECKQVDVYHSLPAGIKDEILEPTTWIIEYRIPLSLIKRHKQYQKPAPGVKWKINLFKCADETSHPHWLTWSVIDLPKPMFHAPEFFGTIEFV